MCMDVSVDVCCVCMHVCMHVCCVCVPLRESDHGWMYMTKDAKLQVYKRLPRNWGRYAWCVTYLCGTNAHL